MICAAKVDCTGAAETCQRLKQTCASDSAETSEVEQELADALQQAQSGTGAPTSSDPLGRLSRSVSVTSCTEQQARDGKCGMLYNAKELVSSVVDSLKYAVDSLNQASRALQGN